MNLLMLSGDNSIARGQGGAFDEMLRRFSAYWSRIDVLTPAAPDAAPRVIHDNVYVHPSPWHRALQPVFIRRKGGALLAERDYALVTSQDFGFFYNGVGAWWLLRGRKIPLVSEVHHVEGYPLALSRRETVWRWTARHYLPWAARHVAAFRVVNAREVPELLRRLGVSDRQIMVLPSVYLDLDVWRPLPDVAKAYDTLFVGRLVANKGIFLILEALAQARQSYPSVRLGIRGDGPLRLQVMRFIETHDLEANVEFIPRVDTPAEMARLYNAARLLVCASTVEGSPRVTLEAMACGVPVISTPVGIMPEVIRDGENGFLIPRDPGLLAEFIEHLLADEGLRTRIGEAGRQVARQFEAAKMIEQYAQAYQALARRTP